MAVKYGLEKTKPVVQRLINTVATIIANYHELIPRTTTNSMEELISNITKDIGRWLADMKQKITDCHNTQSIIFQLQYFKEYTQEALRQM